MKHTKPFFQTLLVSLLFLSIAFSQTTLSLTVSGLAPVNDIQMYYALYSEGEPLLLIHGGLGNADYWENQLEALSENYKLIVIDSRGHGQSK
jgi:hypothetical protein